MTKTRWSHLVMALLAVTAVGCSDGASRLSPLGPSPVAEVPRTTPAATAASWARANGWSTMADGRVAVADGVAVEAVEVVSSVNGSCPSRTIVIRGIPVAVTVSTVYASPLSCATLESGSLVKITGVLIYTAGGFTVTATHVTSMSAAASSLPPSGGEKLSGEGMVGPVAGNCPSLTFEMMGYRVHTTTSTAYATGSSCEGLRQGMSIRVDVDKQPDGTIYAERIEVVSSGSRQ